MTLMSCGAVDDAAPFGDPSTPSPDQAGTTEQAVSISLINGYGVMQNGNRCWFDTPTSKWPGGKCMVPKGRTIGYFLTPSSCTGPFAADYAAAMQSAFHYVASELSLNGFAANLNAGGDVTATVRCDTPSSIDGATTIAQVNLRTVSTDCSSITQGNLCRVAQAQIRAFQSRIETGIFPSTVQDKRRIALENIFRHYMMHVAGLGNELCGADPLTDLMEFFSCRDRNDPRTWRLANLQKFERDALFAYRP
jgi:hypothetical protein